MVQENVDNRQSLGADIGANEHAFTCQSSTRHRTKEPIGGFFPDQVANEAEIYIQQKFIFLATLHLFIETVATNCVAHRSASWTIAYYQNHNAKPAIVSETDRSMIRPSRNVLSV